jgi:hypothetical protein
MAMLTVVFAALFLPIPNALWADTLPSLSSCDWAVTASPNLAIHPPPADTVRKFMELLEFNALSNSETRVCSFRFANLRHSKNLTLLVTLYDGGRGGCGSLYIIDRTAAGFQMRVGYNNPAGIDDVNQVVRDLNHDGKLVLIFDREFTDYEGANHCFATWPVIYAWDGSNYANVSAHPHFIPFYEQKIKTLNLGPPDDCDKATIAKIQRFLGAPPNTGLSEAIAWAQSTDHFQREFAVGLLSDIGTPEARKYLRILTSDPDNIVAIEAKTKFAYRHFDQPPAEPEFLESQDPADQTAADNQAQLAQSAEPWRLIVPPTINGNPDLKASESKWLLMHGYDSREQCQFGFELMRQEASGEGPAYFAYLTMPHGKCVPAPAH